MTPGWEPLLEGCVATAQSQGFLRKRSRCAIDATGLESRYIGRDYVWRRGNEGYPLRSDDSHS